MILTFDHAQIDFADLGQGEIDFIERHEKRGRRSIERRLPNVFRHLGVPSLVVVGGGWWVPVGARTCAPDNT